MQTVKIHTFNTGREYTEHGQRIAWTLLLREVGGGNIVAFVDADRGVSNVVRVPGHLFPENLTVLLQYDECAYLRNYFIPGEVEVALRDAALKHGEPVLNAADQLREQYGQWGEHPDHPLRDWQHEVENDYIRSGYWDWVANEIACAEGFAEEAPSEG